MHKQDVEGEAVENSTTLYSTLDSLTITVCDGRVRHQSLKKFLNYNMSLF